MSCIYRQAFYDEALKMILFSGGYFHQMGSAGWELREPGLFTTMPPLVPQIRSKATASKAAGLRKRRQS